MTLAEKLRNAAVRPGDWDMPGLLEDAAHTLEVYARYDAKMFGLTRTICLTCGTDPRYCHCHEQVRHEI